MSSQGLRNSYLVWSYSVCIHDRHRTGGGAEGAPHFLEIYYIHRHFETLSVQYNYNSLFIHVTLRNLQNSLKRVRA